MLQPVQTLAENLDMLPPAFTLASYQFVIEFAETAQLPIFKGAALRGGFGHVFKRMVCSQHCQRACSLGNACPYGYVFETTPPASATALRNLAEIPRPFVIAPPPDQRIRFLAGEQLTFRLSLFGHGLNYLPYFIVVFQELGKEGLGTGRHHYQLQQVRALSPDQTSGQTIYQTPDDTIRAADNVAFTADIMAQANQLDKQPLTLFFLTPTRLKHGGAWVRQGPPFEAVIKTLLGRVSSLSYFHCGQKFETDFRGLIDRATGVRIAQGDTRWEDWSRVSGRQNKRIHMGGLVGQVTYEGALGDYLPLLVLGQYIHLGKGTVFGNGQYEIVGRRE